MRKARADGKGIEDVGAGRRAKEKIERLREVKPKQRNEGEVIVGDERLRDIVFSTSIAIYTCEPSGDYKATFISDNVTKIVGYEPADFLGVPGFWIDRVHPEDRERILGELPRLFERGTYTYEYRFLHKDGAYIWVRDEMKLVRDAAGKPAEIIGFWIDITERKRAEEGAAREQNLLRTLIDNIPDEIYVKDAESRFILCNRAVAEHRGATGAEELIGKTDFDLYPRQEAQHCYEQEQQIMRSGKPMNSFLQADCDQAGNEIIGLTTKMPLRDTRGEVVGVVGISRNVTEEKKAERALAEERNLLRAVIENTPDQVYVKDVEGRFVLCNEAVAKLLGKRVSDVIGKTDFDLFDKELAEKFFAEEQEVLRMGRALENKETYGIDWQGKEGWALATKAPLKDADGRITGIVGINRDITERKRADEQLQEERNLLRILIDNIPDRVYVKDRESRFLLCNSAVAEHEGKKRTEDVIGKTDFDFYPEDKAARFRADEQEIMRVGQPMINREEICEDKAGNIKSVLSTKIPFRDSEGNVVGIVGINRDITERKKAEDELIRLNKVMGAIADVNQDIFRKKDRKELLRSVCERIVEHAYKMVWIGFCDEKSKLIVPQVQAGFEEGYLTSVKITCNDSEYGMGPTGVAVKTGKPNVMRFIATDERYKPWREEAMKRGYRSSAAIPIFGADDKTIGALNVYSDEEDAFGGEEVKLLEELAHDISTGLRGIDEELRRRKAEERILEYQSHLKNLASQLTLAEERERRRIAGELHDQVSQSLALAKIKLDALRASATSKRPGEVLADVSETIEKAIGDTRSLTFDLSCPTLYELGFEAAVSEWLEEKIGKEYGIKTEFEDDGSSKPLLDDIRVLMFRSVRELLINIVKHSQASKVKVAVRKADDEIEVRIEDNGIGFNPQEAAAMAARRGEFGLFNIKERLEEVDGKLLIESAPGAGCKATIRAPLKRKGIDDERNKAAHQGNGN